MSIKFWIVIFLFSVNSCKTSHSEMEICFENIQKRIGSDSVLKKLMLSPIDSYVDFASIINNAVNEESKSNSICATAIKFFTG